MDFKEILELIDAIDKSKLTKFSFNGNQYNLNFIKNCQNSGISFNNISSEIKLKT